MGVLYQAMLWGMFATAIPPIIHLLNRRRYEIIDWGAMQFLQISQTTRRRLLIEEILLMLLRMIIIALLVLVLANPYLDRSSLYNQFNLAPESTEWMGFGQRKNRDIVLILDHSASMGRKTEGKTVHQRAQEWTRDFFNRLEPDDAVAFIVARRQPDVVVPRFTSDLQFVHEKMERLSEPAGDADLPRAVQAAYVLLDKSERSERTIVVLSDNQRQGWSDTLNLTRWGSLEENYNEPAEFKPQLWAVNLDPHRETEPTNWALGALTTTWSRVAAGEKVKFQTALLISGSARKEPPREIRVEVDGEVKKKLPLPPVERLQTGRVLLDFDVEMDIVGSHLVSVIVDPELPVKDRPTNYEPRDPLPNDNRRDFAIQVEAGKPVLIVDGEDRDSKGPRASRFIKVALAPEREDKEGESSKEKPAFRVRVIRAEEFTAEQLKDDPPRALILNNVPSLTDVQQKLIEGFLKDGGGVLVTLGNRVVAADYNEKFFARKGVDKSDGKGWLPAKLVKQEGEEDKIERAARPVRESFTHPSLEKFKNSGLIGLDDVWFARWWQLTPPEKEAQGTVVAVLDRKETPLLVEKKWEQGRVILCSVPLDNSWRTNVTGLPAYVPMLHELVKYLMDPGAGASAVHPKRRTSWNNLGPGDPIRYRLPAKGEVKSMTLQSPADARPRELVISEKESAKVYNARREDHPLGALITFDNVNLAGVWTLEAGKETVHYVVGTDEAEADLTPMDSKDYDRLDNNLEFQRENEVEELVQTMSGASDRLFLWWWCLTAVLFLLCVEAWLTRYISRNRV